MLKLIEFGIDVSENFDVKPLTYQINQGEIITLVGESGSGKTTLAKGLSGNLDPNTKALGQVIYQDLDLYQLSHRQLQDTHRNQIAYSYQLCGDIFNPRMTVQEHLVEALGKKDLLIITYWLKRLNLEEELLNHYPSQLSGGQSQRINLIMAFIREPQVVILDEPTSALDDETSQLVVDLIKEVNRRNQTTIIAITHHFSLAYELDGITMVMYDGAVVEVGPTQKIIRQPKHPYTRGLLNSTTEFNPYKDIWGIKAGARNRQGCPFFHRCTQALPACQFDTYHLDQVEGDQESYIYCYRGGLVDLLTVSNLRKSFGEAEILKDVNLHIQAGEIVSVIGESGSGKSTLLNCVLGFIKKDQGHVFLDSKAIDYQKIWRDKNQIQYVMQDSSCALNPNFTVKEAIEEPIAINQLEGDLDEVLRLVGLEADDYFKHQRIQFLSGGQKQRVSLARALMMEPRLLVADEPTSMLDPSNQANVLHLLKDLQNNQGHALLIVSHDIDSVVKISDRIYRLSKGQLEEFDRLDMKELIEGHSGGG